MSDFFRGEILAADKLNREIAEKLPLAGGTMTGPLILFQNPHALAEAATKQYVDSVASGQGGLFLPLTGGTLSGPLILTGGDPVGALGATTKTYVDVRANQARDEAITTGHATFVNVTGDAMVGPLTLPGDPQDDNHAATKHYVDAFTGGGGGGGGGGDTAGNILIKLRTVDGPGSGLDADFFDSQDSPFYRDRNNHTGTQSITTIANLQSSLDLKAPLLSPTFTGTPNAPTPTAGDNSTRISTTAYVLNALATSGSTFPSNTLPLMDAAAAAGTSALYSRGDHIHPVDTSRYPVTNPAGYLDTVAVTALLPGQYTSNPTMDGTAGPGTSPLYSRGDHKHPSDTSRVPEAPIDGSQYGRLNATWTKTSTAPSAITTISPTPPVGPTDGQLWWSTTDGNLYIRHGTAWTTAPGTVSTAESLVGVSTFNGRIDDVILTSKDVTTALTFTPYNATNPSKYQTDVDVAATVPDPSALLPSMDAVTAYAGVATVYARGDHAHPRDTTKISDAPSDSKQYARKNAAWAEIVAPSVASASTVSPTAPSGAVTGQLWWSTTDGALYVYANNAWAYAAGANNAVVTP